MAFNGLHVLCGTAGFWAFDGATIELMKGAEWSESPASGVPTAEAAPHLSSKGHPLFRIYSSVDAWVSIGPSPDPTANPRHYVIAYQYYDIGADAGDRLAWVAA